jgi:RND family efflux transporter MFP subunit
MHRTVLALTAGLILGAAGAGVIAVLRERGHAHGPGVPTAEGPRTTQMTIWGERFELFIEHPIPVAGAAARFVIHVSDLRHAAPRREGGIGLQLRRGDDPAIDLREDAPARAGIYLPSITFPKPGEWWITVTILADGEEHAVPLPPIAVHATAEEAARAPAAEAPEGISFLKEQQWKLGTRVERVERATVVERLRVPGVVVARPGGRSAVHPPVDGRLLAPPGGRLPAPGERVAAGQLLALVQPPFTDFGAKFVEAEAGVVRAKLALDLAESAAARMRGLAKEKARSARELEEAENALAQARAAHDGALAVRAAYAKSGATLADGAAVFEVRSPVSGVVTQVGATAGESVHAAHAYFTVVDASTVHIEARVPESAVGRFSAAMRAVIETPDALGAPGAVADRVVMLSPEVDPGTRTVALVYEAANAEGRLRIGMGVTLHVETSRAEEAVAVPESALVEEEGRSVAFVQKGGEAFEKREVAVGLRDAGKVQVLSGLEEGERVVTKGAYAVRLASVATSVPAHSHAH